VSICTKMLQFQHEVGLIGFIIGLIWVSLALEVLTFSCGQRNHFVGIQTKLILFQAMVGH